MIIRNLFLLIFLSVFISACASVKYYPEKSNKNVELIIEKEDGSVFSGMEAGVHLYSIDKKCELTHLGYVEIEKAKTRIGVDTGKQTYIDFVFVSSGMFSNNSSMTYGSVLKPKKGYHYQLKASYIEGIYDLKILEKRKGKKTRQLETYDYNQCNS